MMSLFNEHLKIQRLKAKARIHYAAYQAELSKMDCGAAMAEIISREALRNKQEFNRTMDELTAIDSSCPTCRL